MRFAPDYVAEPAKAIYRIYRDTRFSKDKTPYKTHIAAIFPRRGTGEARRRGPVLQRLAEGNRGGGRRLHAGAGRAAGHPHASGRAS